MEHERQMTKQEAIKQAYGEYWEQVKNHVTSDGWVKEKYLRGRFTDFKISFESFSYFTRPLTLQGIENNKGWIKIEGEYDLPIENTPCYFILRSNKEMLAGHFRHFKDGCFYYDLTYYDLDDVTHYQPIIKPEPPIF